MKTLNNDYKNSHYIDPKVSYIFVLNNANEANIAGDMPRAKQFGYVFKSGNSYLSQTIAHELAHGIFRLKHSFEGYGFSQQELAENLLNYSNGESLLKLQWDYLHDPAMVLTPFESESSGQAIIVNNIGTKFLNPDKKTYSFYGANGTFITLPSHTFNHTFFYGVSDFSWHKLPTGALTSFSAKVGGATKHYQLKWSDNRIIGFVRKGIEDEMAPDSLFKTVYVDSLVIGVAYSNSYSILKVRAAGLQNFLSSASKDFVFEPVMTFNPFSSSPINSSNKKSFSLSLFTLSYLIYSANTLMTGIIPCLQIVTL